MEHLRRSKLIRLAIGFSLCILLLLFFHLYRNANPPIHRDPTVKVTLREGLTNAEMASALAAKLPLFHTDVFIKETTGRQGYLFPDTYFFTTTTTTLDVVGVLHMNFNKKIASLQIDTHMSDKDFANTIIMASLIEKEASGKSDAGMISGILWKRISLGMPLQVDADKSTYSKLGLPISPIANPGIVSIYAALHPVNSPYLYYLHDKNGMVHYAKTYAEHKANIAKYLR